jgi:hypothetical protein
VHFAATPHMRKIVRTVLLVWRSRDSGWGVLPRDVVLMILRLVMADITQTVDKEEVEKVTAQVRAMVPQAGAPTS